MFSLLIFQIFCSERRICSRFVFHPSIFFCCSLDKKLPQAYVSLKTFSHIASHLTFYPLFANLEIPLEPSSVRPSDRPPPFARLRHNPPVSTPNSSQPTLPTYPLTTFCPHFVPYIIPTSVALLNKSVENTLLHFALEHFLSSKINNCKREIYEKRSFDLNAINFYVN